MELWHRVREVFFPITFDDPLFGRLRYLESIGHWLGRMTFESASNELRVAIPADKYGPQEFHKQFYRDIERNYHKLKPLLELSLIKEFDQMIMGAGMRTNVWDEFSIHELVLPSITVQTHQWQIIFVSKSIDGHFTVYLHDWEITGISFDD